MQLNKSSPYSNWSNVFNTTKTCKKLPCGVKNIRLELRTQKPYQKEEELKSKLHWKPALLSETDKTQLKYITQELSSLTRNANCYPGEYPTAQGNTVITSNSSDENQKLNVYYNCWYELKMAAVDDLYSPTKVAGERTRIFRVPKCILISGDEICGCPSLDEGTVHIKDSINARFTRDTRNNNHVTMFLKWTDVTWKNAKKITYFKVQISNGRSLILKEYVSAFSNVSDRSTMNYLTAV
ncbi:Hypothetical predicted protein [Paramuricea clavata]|uniref:Uncharacterized protein n=1 Tax=Paramuricea clavata TaxID=317549 RepID=A0A7D9HCP6_PARCT|nr:Hypothetical predicted protein [Paramuricea clavata]